MPEDCFLVGYETMLQQLFWQGQWIWLKSNEPDHDKSNEMDGRIQPDISSCRDGGSGLYTQAYTHYSPNADCKYRDVTKPAARYLGVMLDTKITFGEHIRKIADVYK
uniref:Putative RNA-directed DNA polymerase from transposon X-element n=1 Tax=Lygus hesperus TaxID=30085 RepID=A0A0A9YG71_LYGHE